MTSDNFARYIPPIFVIYRISQIENYGCGRSNLGASQFVGRAVGLQALRAISACGKSAGRILILNFLSELQIAPLREPSVIQRR